MILVCFSDGNGKEILSSWILADKEKNWDGELYHLAWAELTRYRIREIGGFIQERFGCKDFCVSSFGATSRTKTLRMTNESTTKEEQVKGSNRRYAIYLL